MAQAAGSRTLPDTLKVKLILGWGKLRRWYLLTFRPAYVEAAHKRRRGHCNRTGACCRLMFTCPALNHPEGGDPQCKVYQFRPKNCSIFPIDERDLRDRDLVMPNKPCGFSFVKEGE